MATAGVGVGGKMNILNKKFFSTSRHKFCITYENEMHTFSKYTIKLFYVGL